MKINAPRTTNEAVDDEESGNASLLNMASLNDGADAGASAGAGFDMFTFILINASQTCVAVADIFK